MRKILLDINIILDVLLGRHESSGKVWKLCELGKIKGYLAAHSLPTIFYFLSKNTSLKQCYDILNDLLLVFNIAPLDGSAIKKALRLDFKDFEDACQVTCAQKAGAECIVTRNIENFKNSPVKAVSPEQFLEGIE